MVGRVDLTPDPDRVQVRSFSVRIVASSDQNNSGLKQLKSRNDSGGDGLGEDDDDDEWEGVECTELDDAFSDATAFVAAVAADRLSQKVPNEVQLQLYGLYKIATEGPYQYTIVQRGDVPPLIEMLTSSDVQLKEMSAFALGRLAQDTHNQAGIILNGGITPLLNLLDSKSGPLQHNSAFSLYGLADNEVEGIVSLSYQDWSCSETPGRRVHFSGLELLLDLLESKSFKQQQAGSEAMYKLATKGISLSSVVLPRYHQPLRFDKKNREYDIVVESSISGKKDPEMWISMDGVVLVHVKNLQWKFRGNQTILVDKQPVQVMWDVHDWLFSNLGTGHGVFIFKLVMAESESDKEGSGYRGDNDSESKYYSTLGVDTTSEFNLFLIAWKIE
ncbi:DDB1- and CUL4-associated factor 8-like [Hibiscus syriacus]|uniref:DDB1-and CUL4-associated factor 8-like n=1 Tax=Hibiscus syriacus TaxID=106335 RepID=A0A6A2ZYG7_HIBSY|nr:DDB1- and CUL4-associated factor 8-like [Hibiscus syriacus]